MRKMGDNKVFLFGSFTEDETRSFLQCKPTRDYEKLVEKRDIQFGSLNLAAGKSLISSNSELKGQKGSPREGTVIFQSSSIHQKDDRGTEAPSNYSSGVSNHLKENGSIKRFAQSSSLDNGMGVRTDSIDLDSSSNSNSGSSSFYQGSNLKFHALDGEILEDRDSNLSENDTRKNNRLASEPITAVKNFVPRGLINAGNLCFLNATLQALLSCLPFVQLLQELQLCKIPKAGFPTLTAFVKLLSELNAPSGSSVRNNAVLFEGGRPFTPAMFEEVLRNFTPDVPNNMTGRPRQEDAQELLSFIMDQMHDELLKLGGQSSCVTGAKSYIVSSSAAATGDVDDDEDDEWETVGPKNKSAVTRTQSFVPSELSDIFGGQLRSVVKARGTKASATVQPYLLLHLDIYPEAVYTIEDALRLFSAPEELEGYRASATGKAGVVSARKSIKIQKLSKIMILHLMRFSFGNQGSTKLHKPVQFPLELVLGRDLLVSPSTEGRKYELVATITHHGREPSKGHYTADGRRQDGQWLRFDDASVTAIGTNKVLHDQAYVLFYKQV